ncbi:MAG: hypothetical protein M1835_004607 [Candelina submexicana]|nr:MAG: hypothetical protein M1835_004607 [Candelina submexicana]
MNRLEAGLSSSFKSKEAQSPSSPSSPCASLAAGCSSLPKAYTQFTPHGDKDIRLMPSSNRDHLVDCMWQFVKYTVPIKLHFELFGDRSSECRKERVKATAQRPIKETQVIIFGDKAPNKVHVSTLNK